MKRVLIITYYWPPNGGAGVQRWLKFAKYLPASGWKPVIYTPSNPELIIADPGLERDVPKEAEVIRRPIREPYAIYKWVTGRKGEKVHAGFLNEKKARGGLLDKLAIWVRGNLFIPDARVAWVRPSIRFLTKYLGDHPVDAGGEGLTRRLGLGQHALRQSRLLVGRLGRVDHGLGVTHGQGQFARLEAQRRGLQAHFHRVHRAHATRRVAQQRGKTRLLRPGHRDGLGPVPEFHQDRLRLHRVALREQVGGEIEARGHISLLHARPGRHLRLDGHGADPREEAGGCEQGQGTTRLKLRHVQLHRQTQRPPRSNAVADALCVHVPDLWVMASDATRAPASHGSKPCDHRHVHGRDRSRRIRHGPGGCTAPVREGSGRAAKIMTLPLRCKPTHPLGFPRVSLPDHLVGFCTVKSTGDSGTGSASPTRPPTPSSSWPG